jgi:dCTP deaminase
VILSDVELMNYIKDKLLVVEPFAPEIVKENGLDLRIGNEIARIVSDGTVIDIRNPDFERFYRREPVGEEGFIIYPNERVLATTLENVTLPDSLMAFCELRSTFARLGISIPPTIVDAGFSGNLTIELLGGAAPVQLYPGTRFLHVVFAKLSMPVKKPYRGKYYKQTGVTIPKIEKTE